MVVSISVMWIFYSNKCTYNLNTFIIISIEDWFRKNKLLRGCVLGVIFLLYVEIFTSDAGGSKFFKI